MQELKIAFQQQQEASRDAAEASGARVEQLSEDVLGITSQLSTLTTVVTALAATTAAARTAAYPQAPRWPPRSLSPVVGTQNWRMARD